MTHPLNEQLQKIKIDTRKKASLPVQVADQIKLLIRDKELKEGDLLPAPIALAQSISVDQSVIEEAYDILAQEQFIEASESGFTVVRLQMMEGFLKGFYSVFETFKRHGFEPSSEEIRAETIDDLPSEFTHLSSHVKGPLIHQRRLYKVNDKPLFVVDFYNLPEYFEGHELPLKDIDFLDYFKHELNRPMVRFNREVLAMTPPEEVGELLDIPAQNAILGAKLINYDQAGIPLNFSTWYGSLKFGFWLKSDVKL